MNILPILFWGTVTALLAYRKGYNPLCWFFAGSWFLLGTVAGLVVLAFRPSAKRVELSMEDRLRLQQQGNRIGIILSVLMTVVMVTIGVIVG